MNVTIPAGLNNLTDEDKLYSEFASHAESDLYVETPKMAFTWAPHPDRYPSGKPRSQYKFLLNYLLLLPAIKKTFNHFLFTPELTINGNVHIHGWYTVIDKVKYFKWFLPKVKAMGFLLIKPVKDYGWFDYVKKDIGLMNHLLTPDMPIPLTHQNFDSYREKFDFKRARKPKIKKTPSKMDLSKLFNLH